MAKVKVSLMDNLAAMKEILIFRYSIVFKTINKYGKGFLPGALFIILLSNLVFFYDGITLSKFLSFCLDFVLVFISAALVLFIGGRMFKGKGNYWGLFSSLSYAQVALALLSVIFLFTKLFPALNMLFLILALIIPLYTLLLGMIAISICHKIKGWQSFVTIFLAGIIIFAINKSFALLLKLPTGTIAGEAIRLI